MQRIPFAEAISEKRLFKRSFSKFSLPQQVVLKGIYGLALSAPERRIWNILNGRALYDQLGYPVDSSGDYPYYDGVENEDATIIIGRRGGKSSLSGFLAAYEALCGGHSEYVTAPQLPVILVVAQDLLTARMNQRSFILRYLQESPIGEVELGDLNKSVTADQIRLKSALIMVGPPSIKLRGQPVSIAFMDEVAVWPKDRESANPDSEVENAVRPAMAQFPFRKILKVSSPMTEEGILFEAAERHRKGTLRPKEIVLQAPTALMENPAFTPGELKRYLAQERERDSESFAREYLARFAKSVSGFLSPQLLRAAVDTGMKHRKPQPGRLYIAAMDPAFRHDGFAFAIGHLEGGAFVLDFLQQWKGSKDSPLSPLLVIGTIAKICKEFSIQNIVSDQYHLETLQTLALSFGLTIEAKLLTIESKAKIWSDFSALLALRKLRLLDDDEALNQLMKMEKKITSAGSVTFEGGSKYDDLAMVIALCAHRSLEFGELQPQRQEKVPQTISEMFWQAQDPKRREAAAAARREWWE